MKKDKFRAFFLFPVLVVMLVSGCTTTPSGSGVVIENFEPDFNDVFSGEKISFQVKLRNTGSVDAKDVQVKLLGLEEWDGSKDCDVSGSLLAPSPTFGTTGEVHVCSFSVTAPEVPKGLPVTYQVTARVSYAYGSSTIKTINIGSQAELRMIENLGTALPSETTSITTSPVALNIINKGPIRVFAGSVTFPLEITITNVGGGVVCKGDCSNNENWNRIEIQTYKGSEPVPGCTEEFTLFKGQSNTITCKANVDEPEVGIVQQPIMVESSYNYFYDVMTSVRVNPVSY